MTDESGVSDAAAAVPLPPPLPPSPPVTAGALLRQAREASGLHIAALAVAMKVPVAKLEALEADRFDLLPDAVFARALASGVCRALKVDARQVLDKLPQSAKPLLKDNERGIDAPFRSPSDGPGPSLLDQLSWPVWVVAGLMLAIGVVYFYPHVRPEAPAPAGAAQDIMPLDRSGVPQVVQSPDAPPPGAVADAPVPVVVQAPAPAPSPAPAPASLPVVQKASAAALAGVISKPLPPVVVAQALPPPAAAVLPASRPASAVAATAAQPRASQAAALPPAKPAASAPASVPVATALQPVAFAANAGMLVLRARTPSWVSVMDAKGNSLVNKVLAAGEVAAASGMAPLRVTVGKADGTEVLVRGKAFDLSAVSRENVARFEVK